MSVQISQMKVCVLGALPDKDVLILCFLSAGGHSLQVLRDPVMGNRMKEWNISP